MHVIIIRTMSGVAWDIWSGPHCIATGTTKSAAAAKREVKETLDDLGLAQVRLDSYWIEE